MKNQKAVLIKDESGNVIEKRIYGGDTSKLEENLANEKVVYVVFDDDTDPLFLNAEMLPSRPTLEDRVRALEDALKVGVSENG